MKRITLTEDEADLVKNTLFAIYSDETKEAYIQFGVSKHWERHAFLSAKGEHMLAIVVQKIADA